MTSMATMNTASASTITDIPLSTLTPNSFSQFQTEIAYEGVSEAPSQEDPSQIDNAAATNSTFQTLYQCTQQDPHDNEDLTPFPVILENPHGHAMSVTPPQEHHSPQVCQICGEGDSETRRLCVFNPNGYTQTQCAHVIHEFCGKTAAILPKINRPDLEILPKSGIKKKFGTGPILTVALQRARTAVVDGKVYYLTAEVQEHVSQLSHQLTMSPSTPVEQLSSFYTPEATTASNADGSTTTSTTTTPNYTNPRPPPETMEALKKITPPSPPRKKLKTMKSPYELLMERLQYTSNAIGGIGYSLVRGVAPATQEHDHAEQDEENFNPNLCSQTQVDHVRIMIVTQDRQEEMTAMASHFQQASETEFASHVWDTWRLFQCKYRNQKCWKLKLNMILGFTDAIKDYDGWMVSTAYPWNELTMGLGRLWKALLKKSSQELGVDVEFTLPGILCLLQDFQEQVESVETTVMQFQYQAPGTK